MQAHDVYYMDRINKSKLSDNSDSSMDSLQRAQIKAQKIFQIDGENLTPEILQTIIEDNWQIDLTPKAWENVRKSREIIQEMMADPKRVVYGINTGFGNFADKIITHEQRSQLQINLIRSHAVGVGQPVPVKTVKRMTILRINTLAKGRSGIDPVNLQKMVKAYNKNHIPMIPEKGTVGASGDLAPLAHLALGMIGQGFSWNQEVQRYTETRQLMKKKGIEPLELHQKQGLALINGTQFMCSIICEVATLSKNLLDSAIIIYAFAVEIFGLDREYFSETFVKFYQKRNSKLAEILRRIGSYLDATSSELHQNRMTQEREKPQNIMSSSILNQPQSLAGFKESLQFATRMITEEINSATDNPLVYSKQDGFEQDMLVSAGNFHGQYVAKASDFIGMALFNIGRFSESRIQRYVNGRTSKLPDFLVKFGGLNSGFMISQYTSASLLSESKVLVKPASVDSISTSASQEDHVSMGGFAARKAKILYENVAYILGIQLMCALQSIDLLELKPSSKLGEIKKKIREKISYMPVDKYFGPEITLAKQLVKQGLGNL